MILEACAALQQAGYDLTILKVVIHADLPSGYRGMSLDDGAALGAEAFSSPAMLNHVLEEEVLHLYQKAAGFAQAFGPDTVRELEDRIHAARRFPFPGP